MVDTAKLSPRVDTEIKECLDRHVDRVNSSQGEEVEKALKNWLATYYLIHEDARNDLPEEDSELIEKLIAKQTYEVTNAYENLNATRPPAEKTQAAENLSQDQLDDIIDQADPDELRQSVKNLFREVEN